jgi:copper chaperone CopZ
MTTERFAVAGMTCGHCERAVTEALSGLPGVDAVDVNLERGEVTVTSDRAVDHADVRRVVSDAGYQVVSCTS